MGEVKLVESSRLGSGQMRLGRVELVRVGFGRFVSRSGRPGRVRSGSVELERVGLPVLTTA